MKKILLGSLIATSLFALSNYVPGSKSAKELHDEKRTFKTYNYRSSYEYKPYSYNNKKEEEEEEVIEPEKNRKIYLPNPKVLKLKNLVGHGLTSDGERITLTIKKTYEKYAIERYKIEDIQDGYKYLEITCHQKEDIENDWHYSDCSVDTRN